MANHLTPKTLNVEPIDLFEHVDADAILLPARHWQQDQDDSPHSFCAICGTAIDNATDRNVVGTINTLRESDRSEWQRLHKLRRRINYVCRGCSCLLQFAVPGRPSEDFFEAAIALHLADRPAREADQLTRALALCARRRCEVFAAIGGPNADADTCDEFMRHAASRLLQMRSAGWSLDVQLATLAGFVMTDLRRLLTPQMDGPIYRIESEPPAWFDLSAPLRSNRTPPPMVATA